MNQDYIFTSDIPVNSLPNLYIVADGMGGHNAGDYASSFTVEPCCCRVVSAEDAPLIRPAFWRKHCRRLMPPSAGSLRRTGPFSEWERHLCARHHIGRLLAANVGDSRLYVLHPPARIRQVTVDHSLVEEMVQAGRIDRETARQMPDKNIITRAVGAEDDLKVDFFREVLTDGDLLLLCSDGLTNMLKEEEIAEIVFSFRSLEKAADRLVYAANMAGGADNISVVLVNPFDSGRLLA